MTRDLEARLSLVCLPGIGPARARWLLGDRDAAAVVADLRSGRYPPDLGPAPPGVTRELVSSWGRALAALDVEGVLAGHRSLGIELLSPTDRRWPFNRDPEPPLLLFYRGDVELLARPRAVAVVGTRRCTTVGRTVAYQLGRDLASAGVAVVSGLALGIDGAAHRGALDVEGAVVGVVGSGIDVVYPRANGTLWEDVGQRGLLLSEAPAGAPPERWRFPARNRLIAGLSDGVVIVESHERGGALLTVDEAIDRSVPVFAVPGSVLSPASDGSNALLVEGAIPVRGAADVLDHLGPPPGPAVPPAAGPGPPTGPTVGRPPRPDSVPSPGGTVADRSAGEPGAAPETGPVEPGSAVQRREPGSVRRVGGDHWPNGGQGDLVGVILAEASTGPIHLDRLIQACGRPAAEVMAAVHALAVEGRIGVDGATVSLRCESL